MNQKDIHSNLSRSNSYFSLPEIMNTGGKYNVYSVIYRHTGYT